MAFLIANSLRTYTSRVLPVLSKIALPTFTKTRCSKEDLSHLSSSVEASLVAVSGMPVAQHLQTQSPPATLPLRLPTLDKNLDVSVYNPLIKPCVEDSPLLSNILEKFDPLSITQIQDPFQQIIKKDAAHLVVIRRRKMRRHKLRKLRKKMRFVWAKVRQKREFVKEKAFQAEEMEKIREAEAFDPVAYVNNIIAKTKEKPELTTWKEKGFSRDVINITINNKGK